MDLITRAEAYLDPPQDLAGTPTTLAPILDWRTMSPTDHFVQFYENDVSLVDAVSGFIGVGFERRESCIVIATPTHRASLENKLKELGFDVTTLHAQGHYIPLDAAATLSRFMREKTPEPQCFEETIGRVIARAGEGGRRVRAFGEMVSLLWAEGNQDGAIRLEELWNELAKTRPFSLFCAYSMQDFDSEAHAAPFHQICTQHSCVVPAESYAALSSTDERMREISRLQQKAQALEAEIAQRRQAEKALACRERELSDFLDSALEGIHKVGPDGTVLWANRAELDLLGYTPDEYIGHSITEFHADPDVIEAMLTQLRGGEALYNHPARLRCKDGSIKHVLVHSNGYFEDGQFLYSRCFTRDVTYFKEAEIAQQRLAAIIGSSDDAIIGKTLEGIITSWNRGAERIFGYTEEEAVGRPKTMLFPPDLLGEEDVILARLRRGERIEHFESVRVRKDGRQIDVSLTISPIKDSQGTIVGASTIARDITGAKEQQRELAALNARLKRSMTETHHRVKNNLQVIAAMIDMQALDHRAEQAIPIEEFDRLKSHIGTLAIVHDLLTHSIKEAEESQFISTKAVLDRLLPMLQQTAWKRTVRFEIADTEVPSKQCVSLALVLNELVSNSIKHGKSETEVTFAVQGGQASLEVCDDGPGFPENFNALACANTGLELVESLVCTDLAGQTYYENRQEGGARVRVTFDLPALDQ
jgi:PAS domain S-box-containing protein